MAALGSTARPDAPLFVHEVECGSQAVRWPDQSPRNLLRIGNYLRAQSETKWKFNPFGPKYVALMKAETALEKDCPRLIEWT